MKLHWQILFALLAGAVFGIFLPDQVGLIKWIGDLFLRGLNMVVIPLVISSIVVGIVNVGTGSNLSRLGLKSILFFLSTTLVAIVTGLLFVNIFKPGNNVNLVKSAVTGVAVAPKSSFVDMLVNIVPSNIFSDLATGSDRLLGIIFFSILFAIYLSKQEPKFRDNLANLFESVFQIIMKITGLVIKFSPFGVFALIAVQFSHYTGDSQQLVNVIGSLGAYLLTIIGALLFHSFITLSLVLFFFVRVNPFKHILNMMSPLLMSFSSSSSSATLPLTLREIEEKSGVSNRVTSFVIPLGTAINRNGTALFECGAAIFVAQAYGIELSIAQQFLLVATTLLASIGAAGIPMAAFVMMSVILDSAGIPKEGLGLLLVVDRILDMFRTATNVYGNTCAALFVARLEKEKLSRQ
jgi:Na+/H+-dicarboxylate symporters